MAKWQPESIKQQLGFDQSGAYSSSLCATHRVMVDVCGEKVMTKESGPTALHYLYRRFGPPKPPYINPPKYVLTTPDPTVFVVIEPIAGPIYYNVGYRVPQVLETRWMRAQAAGDPLIENTIVQQVRDAVSATFRALLTWIPSGDDVEINLIDAREQA